MPIRDGVYIYNEKNLQAYCSKALLLKGGGHLLSRIALQYHQRRRA